jgi:calcineurin-like phosphoesterase family protein
MYFFTADEHYGHSNIIKYCNRPFTNVAEMDDEIIKRHNKIVTKEDIVVHVGDFTLADKIVAQIYINSLNGSHIFIRGSHDYWMKNDSHEIWERTINGIHIVACHYALRVWPRSHYNSYCLYGHSHGKLDPIGKQWDVGVDNNDFYPVSFDKLIEIMKDRLDNPNLVKVRK